MNQIWFALVAFAFLAVAGFFIYLLLELRRSTQAITQLLKTTEESLKPTLEELQLTLKSMRKVTDDINAVTDDIRLISGSTREIGQNFKKASEFFSGVSSEAAIKVSGLRVGIRTALEVLIKNLFFQKGGNQ